jgi:hypothetical protein
VCDRCTETTSGASPLSSKPSGAVPMTGSASAKLYIP